MKKIIKNFLKLEAASGFLLILATILALIINNSKLHYIYEKFIYISIGIQLNSLNVNHSCVWWINEGLMTVFFLIVGLELKRELIEGELAEPSKILLPIIAAIGGMLLPILIYSCLNLDNEITKIGWAIPAATDIAFALGIVALLGKSVPTELKIFLLTLASIDDFGVIIIIAIFYTKSIEIMHLFFSGIFLFILGLMNWKKTQNLTFYLIIGIFLWISILKSGIHATTTGILISCFIPFEKENKIENSPLERLEKNLHPWVAYFILPIFAFVNSGIKINLDVIQNLSNPLIIGIVLGLLIGKPLGIFLFSWISLKFNVGKLPKNITLTQIFPISVFCGIGFTMSIFIANLSFINVNEFNTYARLGIFIGSTLSAIFGLFLLKQVLKCQLHNQAT